MRSRFSVVRAALRPSTPLIDATRYRVCIRIAASTIASVTRGKKTSSGVFTFLRLVGKGEAPSSRLLKL